MDDVHEFWEDRYRSANRVWSGRVNPRLAEVVADLPAGRALDLGCGEGADACWLAERGWRVVAVDVSDTALNRASAEALQRNLAERIDFQRLDLNEAFPAGTFDLVSAQFLQSPVRLEREALLRRAADSLTPGGVLLIVDHGSAPDWAGHNGHHFPSVEDVLASLRLGDGWLRLRADRVDREVVGPQGQTATIFDNVIALRRAVIQAAS